ncbi:MAG: hypothetical protein EP332_12975 [Bacteroidetes bacterium]|nr:MAG: hypothetical protein EP332_12975 [Bacteroidota bacterium]
MTPSKQLLFCVLFLLKFHLLEATTWRAAMPYTQRIEGQSVKIKAQSYDPYIGSPMLGKTSVYHRNKLLYTLDQYYREPLYTSPDGQYLVLVRLTNSIGVGSYISGWGHVNYNQAAIKIFKNGKAIKEYRLRDVIDTAKLAQDGNLFYWGYAKNLKRSKAVQDECEICRESYGKRLLSTCDTSKIKPEECALCRAACDSAQLLSTEERLVKNPIYVSGDTLFILSNQQTVIKLSFHDLSLQISPFEHVVPVKNEYKPPLLKRKYKKIRLPEKFEEPRLKNGKTLEESVAELLDLSVDHDFKGRYAVYMGSLVIDKTGKCIQYDGKVYDNTVSQFMNQQSIQPEMTQKLEA